MVPRRVGSIMGNFSESRTNQAKAVEALGGKNGVVLYQDPHFTAIPTLLRPTRFA